MKDVDGFYYNNDLQVRPEVWMVDLFLSNCVPEGATMTTAKKQEGLCAG